MASGLRLSAKAQKALSSTIAALADADVGNASLCIYEGQRPVDGVPSAKSLLVDVKFAKPAFKPVDDSGMLEAPPLSLGKALRDGKARWAMIRDGAGNAVLDCDVGNTKSDALIKLNTIDIAAGGLIQIESFRLGWPR